MSAVRYPTESQGLGQLMWLSIRHYGVSFVAAWWFILLAAIIQNAYRIVGWVHALSPRVFLMVFDVSVVVAFSCLVVALVATHRAWCGEPVRRSQTLALALKKMLGSWVVAFVYVLLFVVTAYWMNYLAPMQRTPIGQHGFFAQGGIILLALGIPLLLIYFSFLFVIPYWVSGEQGFFTSVARSAAFVWREKFKPALLMYVQIAIISYLIWPFSAHGAWLMHHYLKLVFDVVVCLLLFPVVLNFSLLVVNQARLLRATRLGA